MLAQSSRPDDLTHNRLSVFRIPGKSWLRSQKGQSAGCFFSRPQMTKPVFFPQPKTATDGKNENHVENHRGDEPFIGEIIATVQPTTHTENILQRDCLSTTELCSMKITSFE
ncbi:MAG: hypothetical protein Ct9H300mP16_06170 [Pseudomonadota bacterium]|nr:MAG: hypothetical protein Ct9H300mP16_06170 [Pseudomonadota bacterium]